MSFTRWWVLFAFIFILKSSFSQNSYNSPYSFYGIGFINHKSSSLNRGLAGTGIAIRDRMNLNLVNPASYGSIAWPVSHIYEIGTYVETNRYEASELVESKANGGITNMSYWFKFSTKWAAVAGLSPFSSVSYHINSKRQLGIVDDIEYEFQGSGNITQLYLGNSFKVTENLSVGLNISYLFGSVHKYEYLENALIPGLTYDDKIFANNFDFDAGVQYGFKLKNKELIAGLIIDDGLKLSGTRTGKLYNADGDTLRSINEGSVQYNLPPSVGFGLSLQGERSVIAADIKFENWSEADLANDDMILQDAWKFSGGYYNKGNPNGDSYLNAVGWRGGAHVENFYQLLNGEGILNWGISAGLSFPVFDGKSSLNLTYSFDKIGTVTDGLIEQQSHKFMFDVVIRDLWGGKRAID